MQFFRTTPVVVAGPYRAPGWKSIFDYAISKGSLLVELRQLPQDFNRDQAIDLLREVFQVPLAMRPVTYCFNPEQAGHPAARLIVTYHPAPDLSEQDLAAGQVRSAPPSTPDASVTILAVLAEGDKVQASAQGRIGANDRTSLIKLSRQTIREIIN